MPQLLVLWALSWGLLGTYNLASCALSIELRPLDLLQVISPAQMAETHISGACEHDIFSLIPKLFADGVCDDLSHGTFFFIFLDFRAACTWLSFSKSKGQVISHVMCHVQVMWYIMRLVMWWVRWHVTWWLTHTSCAPTWWLSCWLSTKSWWLTAEDAVSNCGYTYCSDDSFLMNLVMWPLLSSCIKDCVSYPESPSWPLVVLGLR
jgi:hypothetical protein